MALKKKAPKVPNYTCTDIDNIITTLNQLHEGTKKLTKLRLQVLERKLERLEESNASKEIYEEQARKIENDRYFVLCFWWFIPYFALKKIDEMEKINSR